MNEMTIAIICLGLAALTLAFEVVIGWNKIFKFFKVGKNKAKQSKNNQNKA